MSWRIKQRDNSVLYCINIRLIISVRIRLTFLPMSTPTASLKVLPALLWSQSWNSALKWKPFPICSTKKARSSWEHTIHMVLRKHFRSSLARINICSGSTQCGLVGQVIMAIKNYLTSTGLSIKCIAAQLNFDYSTYRSYATREIDYIELFSSYYQSFLRRKSHLSTLTVSWPRLLLGPGADKHSQAEQNTLRKAL